MGRLQNIGGFRTQNKELAQFAGILQREFDNVYRTMPSASSTSAGTTETPAASSGNGVSAADRAKWDYAYNWVKTYVPPTTTHNNLPDLQGGQSGQYYHFNAAQHTELALFSSEFAVAAGTGYASLSLADISEVFRVESEPGANQVGIYFGRPGSTIPPGPQGSYMAFFRAPASGTYNHALGLAAGKQNGEILHLYNWQDAHILRFNTDANEELQIRGTTKADVAQWTMLLGTTPTMEFLGKVTIGSMTAGVRRLTIVPTSTAYDGIRIDGQTANLTTPSIQLYRNAAGSSRGRNWAISIGDNLWDDMTFRVSAAELGDPTGGTIIMQLLGGYSGAKAAFHQTVALRAAVALTALNKAGTAYITVGARNTSGSEMVFDLTAIGKVQFSQATAVQITTSVTNGAIRIGANGTGQTMFNYGAGTGSLVWYGGGTTAKIQMTSTGRLGIGSVAPNVPLQVIGGAIGSVPAAGTYGGAAIFSADANTYGVFIGAITSGVGYIQVQSGASATTYSLLLQPNGGNVGIGTTAPDAKLAVVGGSAKVTSDGNVSGYFLSTGIVDGGMSSLFEWQASRSGTPTVYARWGGIYGDNTTGIGLFSDSRVLHLSTIGAYGISFNINLTAKMVIDSSGNVGIGLTGPASKLHVDGGVLFSHPTGGATVSVRPSTTGNPASVTLYDYSWGKSLSMYMDNAGNSSFTASGQLSIGAGSATAITILATGKIGIGTTSPSYALDVNGEIRGWYGYFNGEGLSTDLRVGGVYNMLGLYVASGYDIMFALGWDGSFKFNRGPNTKAYIDYTGKFWGHQVYVEQSTAASGLYVSGDGVTPQLELHDAYAGESTIYHTTGITWVSYDYSFPLYSGTFLLVNSSTRVGIGTTSPSRALHIKVASPEIQFEDTDTSKSWHIGASGSYFEIVETGVAVNVQFYNGGGMWLSGTFSNTGDSYIGQGGSGTGQRYAYVSPEAANQGGVILRDGTSSKWGLFKTSGNDFLLYNYGLSANAILIDDSTGALTFYGPSASLDKSQSTGETAYWVKNGATRAIGNRASLILNLGANTASSWVIRARQTATSDGAHSIEFYAPDGTLFLSHANGASSPNIPDYVQGANAGDGYSYIRGTDDNVYSFDGSDWQPV